MSGSLNEFSKYPQVCAHTPACTHMGLLMLAYVSPCMEAHAYVFFFSCLSILTMGAVDGCSSYTRFCLFQPLRVCWIKYATLYNMPGWKAIWSGVSTTPHLLHHYEWGHNFSGQMLATCMWHFFSFATLSTLPRFYILKETLKMIELTIILIV